MTDVPEADSVPVRLMVVESDQDESLKGLLSQRWPVLAARNASEALAKIQSDKDPSDIGVVITELSLVDMSGTELLERLAPDIPEALRILVNDSEDVELLIAAINQGHVYLYLHRPFEADAALEAIAGAVAEFARHHQRAAAAKALQQKLAAKDVELAEAYELVEQASLTDALTGLHNRSFIQHHFETELALIQREYHDNPDGQHDLLFILADIDQFTPVNDIYGHAAGDRMLENFACRLQEVFRGSDIVVRWGGDQFLIVARFARRDGGDGVAERLRSAIADVAFDLGKGVKLNKTCSIGFATFPFFAHAPDVIPWTRVVNFADQARLVAKRSGRNCWVGFEPKAGVEPLDAAKRILASPGQACATGILEVSTSAGSPTVLDWG